MLYIVRYEKVKPQPEIIRYKHRKIKMLNKYDTLLNASCPKCGAAVYQNFLIKSNLIIKYECDTTIKHNVECVDFNQKLDQSNFCKSTVIRDYKK